jgi:hypothetical protein
MAATLSAGVGSLILKLDTPYDRVRTTDARDDLEKVQVWCSTTSGFTPSNSNKVFDGLSLSVVISKITTDGTTFTSLIAGTTYYIKYAFISTIDDVSATAFTISSELNAIPIVASAQTVDISGYSAFVKNTAGTGLDPATATLTAVINGITSPVYAWTITGGTLSSSTASSTTVTPSLSTTSVTVTLSVTGTGLVTPIVKTIVMVVASSGATGNSVYVGTVYYQIATAPAAPTGGSYNFSNNVLTAPTLWSATQPATTTIPTYACDFTFSGAPSSTIPATNWSTPYIEAVNGSPGNNGEYRDIIELYLLSASAPIQPTSAQYTFTGNTITSITGGTAGWSLIQPTATTSAVYMTRALASTTTPGTAVSLTSWSIPVIIAQIGASGAPAYSAPTLYISNYGSTFRKDITGSIYPSSVIIETGYSNFKTSPAPTFQWKKNGVNITGATSFSYTVPSTDYASVSTNTYSCTVTGTDILDVVKSVTSSTTIPLISDGAQGPRTANGYLYYQTAVATDPGTPAASNYNFTTGQFGTLTSGWGYTPISASTTNTSLKGWACRYSVIEPSYGTATGAAAISSNSPNISFDGIVTFSNYASGATPLATASSVSSKLSAADLAATGTTVIDGGRITTGVIAAARVDLSGVLTATSVSNTGTTVIDGGRITTGIISANRVDLTGVLRVSSTNGDGSVNTTTQINGGSLQTGSINADRLTIGQTTATNRIRLYDNKIEIWADNGSGTSVRRVVLGDLS